MPSRPLAPLLKAQQSQLWRMLVPEPGMASATAAGRGKPAPPAARPAPRPPYIGVLVGSDGDELSLGKSERLHAAGLAGVLRAVLVHFHYMQAGLVLVQGLQNHHLSGGKKGKRPAAR